MTSTEPAVAGLVRQEEGQLGLSDATLRQLYELMVMARGLDERMWILNRAGQAPFVISCQGHEAAQAGAAFAFEPGKDVLCPYYRDLTLALHFGMTPREVMLAIFARADDPSSGGRQMPAHYGSRRLNIISGSSPVATQTLHATGIALAAKLKGEDTAVLTSLGEGSTSQGDFHEALNFAAIHRLPVIFFVENNGWAISVPLKKQMAVASVAERAAGYGMPGVSVDGSDPLAVYSAMSEAVERARSGGGPSLVEARVYRFTAHSSDDDDRHYRPAGEVDELKSHDPNKRFRDRLIEQGVLTEQQDQEIQARVRAEIDDATDFAERASLPDPSTLTNHVYGS